MKFSTEYSITGQRYTTVLYARSSEDLTLLLKQRGLNEKLISGDFPHPEIPSDLILLHRWADAMHAACWLGMVGCAGGTLEGFDLLNDRGLIHTLSHILRFTNDEMQPRKEFLILLAYAKAKEAERRVPGFDPQAGGEIHHAVYHMSQRLAGMKDLAKRVYREHPEWCGEVKEILTDWG